MGRFLPWLAVALVLAACNGDETCEGDCAVGAGGAGGSGGVGGGGEGLTERYGVASKEQPSDVLVTMNFASFPVSCLDPDGDTPGDPSCPPYWSFYIEIEEFRIQPGPLDASATTWISASDESCVAVFGEVTEVEIMSVSTEEIVIEAHDQLVIALDGTHHAERCY